MSIDLDKAKKDLAEIQAKSQHYHEGVNEGKGGYNPFDHAEEKAIKSVVEIENRIFAEEWTLEVYNQRKVKWNIAVRNLQKTGINSITPDIVRKLEQQTGIMMDDLRRAKHLHDK